MNAKVVLLLLGLTFGCGNDVTHGATKMTGSQGQQQNQPNLFEGLGLDFNLDSDLGSAWDHFFGLEEEVTMGTMERIKYHGYHAESHVTTTKDGYILQLHRIPSKDKSRKPVVLVHGTGSIGDCWVANTKENSLAFVLADSGADVWLVNLRGCQNSIGHTTFETGPFSEKYWKFTFDQMANYDMPAFVDYILQVTKHEQLFLIGHSLGGGLPIFLCAEKPEYNEKVKVIFGLAPLGDLKDFRHRIKWIAQFEDVFQILTKVTSLYELYLPLTKRTMGTLVKLYGWVYKLPWAKDVLLDTKNWNFTRAPNYFTSTLSSTAIILLYHYDQFIRTNGDVGLRHYNWGEQRNLEMYGKADPPLYNLTNVKVPVYLYCGKDDNFISETNVRYLNDRLPNVTTFTIIPHWDHLDFIWACDTGKVLYNELAEIIKDLN